MKMYKNRSILLAAMLLCMTSALIHAESNCSLELVVEPGNKWTKWVWFGPIPMKKRPQLAAWIESSDGSFIKTLTVTTSSADKKWVGNPEGGRPEALPVWTHAQQNSVPVDTISSATPKKGLCLEQAFGSLQPDTEYIIMLEVNSSFDYNDQWPKNASEGSAGFSGVNGQPSLIYKASFYADRPGEYSLRPIGTGSIDGSSGSIKSGTEGLTSALNIIERAVLILE